MAKFDWRCTFCGRSQIVSDSNYYAGARGIDVGETKYGDLVFSTVGIRCANPDCNELTLLADLYVGEHQNNRGYVRTGEYIERWKLRPSSFAKPQPDYIPAPLREDYEEACKIRDLSPKASATLARRCLQGMIRDFCNISKSRLVDEIAELRRRVNAGEAPKGVEDETVDAIDSIREIGNIGAHMERDISLIIEVDPGEAQALIDLIEMLFDEWYVAKHTRQLKLARIEAIGAEKKLQKAESQQVQIEGPKPSTEA